MACYAEVFRVARDIQSPSPETGAGRVSAVKKLLVIALLGLSAFAVWRKVQADRAELNLWTEATTPDE
jgi:hypothetical protein